MTGSPVSGAAQETETVRPVKEAARARGAPGRGFGAATVNDTSGDATLVPYTFTDFTRAKKVPPAGIDTTSEVDGAVCTGRVVAPGALPISTE